MPHLKKKKRKKTLNSDLKEFVYRDDLSSWGGHLLES